MGQVDIATWISDTLAVENALYMIKEITIEHPPTPEQAELLHDAAEKMREVAARSLT